MLELIKAGRSRVITEKVRHMAKEKGVQVSATIPPEWDETLENHRWEVRKTKTQLVRTAIEEYFINHGLVVEPENQPEAPAPDAT